MDSTCHPIPHIHALVPWHGPETDSTNLPSTTRLADLKAPSDTQGPSSAPDLVPPHSLATCPNLVPDPSRRPAAVPLFSTVGLLAAVDNSCLRSFLSFLASCCSSLSGCFRAMQDDVVGSWLAGSINHHSDLTHRHAYAKLVKYTKRYRI
jgi:hypothetical protein